MLYLSPMGLWGLISVGFVLGLTGAMAPGPLLTVTITESTRRGGQVGPLIVLGHGILEMILLILIVFGVGTFLASRLLYTIVSFLGGMVMIYMGAGIIRGLPAYRLDSTAGVNDRRMHPVLAGIVISMSNPYWFIWWLTIGMGYVIFARGFGLAGIAAFFAGHISADLVWYSFVSYGVAVGGRHVSTRVIKVVLFICSLFLFLFGLFFIGKGYQFLTRA